MKKIILGTTMLKQEEKYSSENSVDILPGEIDEKATEECDTPLLTENYSEESASSASIMQDSKEKISDKKSKEVQIVEENVWEREENAKYFRMSDGTCKAVFYSEPIHFYDESEHCYKEIDNTLEVSEKDESEEEDFCGYKNHCGRAKVKFARSASENNLMCVQKDGHKLFWRFLGKGQKESKNLFSDFVGKMPAEAKLCKDEVLKQVKMQPEKEDKHFAFAKKLRDKIKYENIVSGTDLEYTLTGGKIKEDIIVKERASCYEYAFILRAENLDMELSSDGASVEFFVTKFNEDGSTEKSVIFRMPSAYMYDANGARCEDVVYDIEEIGTEKYLLKIVPNAEWINAEERAFPVIIDPTISTSDVWAIQTVSLSEGGSKYIGGYERVSWKGETTNICSYIKLNIPSMTNVRILNAMLQLQFYDYTDSELEVRRITSDWDIETVQWDNRPSYSSEVEGCYSFHRLSSIMNNPEDKIVSIDLTRMARDGFSVLKKGIALEIKTTGTVRFYSETTQSENVFKPALTMTYTSTKAIVGSKQQKNSVNRAGTGVLDLYTRNLQFLHEDIKLDGERMPLNIVHIYNSKFATRMGIVSSTGLPGDNTGMGYGWKTNLHQYIFAYNSMGNEDEFSARAKYIYIDQLGNENILSETKLNANGYKEITDDSGKLIYDDENRILKDKSGNKLYFDNFGRLYRLEDGFGNRTNISFLSDGRMYAVEDGAGRVAWFNYNGVSSTSTEGALLSSISYAQSKRIIRFEYNVDKKLTKIKYQDGTCSEYTYGESGISNYLTSIRDQTGYKLNYQYDDDKITIRESSNISKIADNSVTTCAEKYGNQVEITFVGNRTYIKGKDGKRLVHVFDDSGTAYCSYVDQGTSTGGNIINVVNDIECISSEGDTSYQVSAHRDAKNHVLNGSFTEGNFGWLNSGLTENDSVTTVASAQGTHAFKIWGELRKTKYITQNVNVPDGIDNFIFYGFAKAHSLSPLIRVYINEEGESQEDFPKFLLSAQIFYKDATSEPVRSVNFNYLEEEWQFAAVGVSRSEENKGKEINYITIRAEYSNNQNDVYFDNFGLVAGRFTKQKVIPNYVLERNGAYYDLSQITAVKYTTEELLGIQSWETKDTHKDGKLILTFTDVDRMIRQTVKDGLGCVYIGGELISNKAAIGELFWGDEIAKISFVIGGQNYNAFDFILRSTPSIQVEDGSGRTVEMKTDANGNITKSTVIGEDGLRFETQYTYQNGKQKKQKDLYSGIQSENTYDSHGNLSVSRVRNIYELDTTESMISNYSYNNNGNTLYSENGSRGNGFETITVFNNTFGRLEYMTLPDGTKINYNYYSDDSLQSMSTTVGTDVVANTYNYTRGLLTKVVCNNNEYKFEYDGFGRQTKTTVNGTEFVGNEYYDQSQYNSAFEDTFNYSKITYNIGNGKSYSEKTIYNKSGAPISLQRDGAMAAELLRISYDDYGRVEYMYDKAMGASKITTCHYTYKDDGGLDKVTMTGYRTGELQDTFDRSGRQIGKRVKFGEEKNYTFGYEKDGNNTVPGNRLVAVGLPTGKEVTYDYDSLGRFKKRSIATSGHAVTETYSYLKSNYNPNICQNDRTTEFVSTVQYGGYNYSANAFYTYDKRGNISEVVDNGKTYRYQYDGLDRLVREDNQYMNFTKVYEYDANGNIVKITKYDYTTAETLSGGQVTSYSYDTGAHKDRLVKITYSDGRVENFSSYDFLGNPCSYRGIVIEWERGRQMARYRDVQYSYDVSGIRQEKQVGSLLHKYYTDGGRIYKEERGNDTLWYHYDNTGITGIEYNGTAYYFQKNLQGDVVRIYDGNGNLKAQYFYDAWGNHRICDEFGADITEDVITPEMSFTFATHIGRVNPFRYRGYYYDEETNLYYLQSRYYDPTVCRFINADDVAYIAPETLNGLNVFAYCGNNPVMNVDPNGKFFWLPLLAVIGVSALTGAIDGGITAAMNGQNFWLGFAAGAIGGAVGGVIGYFLAPLGSWGNLLGRVVSSVIYNVANEFFQTGTLGNMDLGLFAVDIVADAVFSMLYIEGAQNIGAKISRLAGGKLVDALKESVTSLVIGGGDAIVDIIQTATWFNKKIQEKIRNGTFFRSI